MSERVVDHLWVQDDRHEVRKWCTTASASASVNAIVQAEIITCLACLRCADRYARQLVNWRIKKIGHV